jgi:hypothetical protein
VHPRREVAGDGGLEQDALLLRARSENALDRPGKLREGEIGGMELDSAGLNLREIQHIVD